MRLPLHAADELAAGPTRESQLRSLAQRLGEMDHWALWAHGGMSSEPERQRGESSLALGLGKNPAARLARLFAAAGYHLHTDNDTLVLDRWPLDADPPDTFELFKVQPGETLADLYDRLDAEPVPPRALVFDPS